MRERLVAPVFDAQGEVPRVILFDSFEVRLDGSNSDLSGRAALQRLTPWLLSGAPGWRCCDPEQGLRVA